MAHGTTRRRRSGGRRPEPPEGRPPRQRLLRTAVWLAAGVLAVAGALLLGKRQAEGHGKQVAPPATGLPHTPDYHALLVSPTDARRLLLGTHVGLYESRDGGRTWRKGPLAGNDAMNLVRTRSVVWAAGHQVLFASADGGRTWHDVRPSGLPRLDLHGFASDPRADATLYAAVAHEGLYRSRDGGSTFVLVTREVGRNVFGLSVLPTGRILAADPERGVLVSDDGGRMWRVALRPPIIGLAVNPTRPETILATGAGVFRSLDGGRRWRRVLVTDQIAGPVAWAPSDPDVAYVVTFAGMLYRTGDGGHSWRPVG